LRAIDATISGGSSETDMKPLAVMPKTSSSTAVVITVTPVANRPMALRNARWSKGWARGLRSCMSGMLAFIP